MAVSPARPGLAPLRTRLSNGAAIVVKETRKSPAVALNVAVRSGTICDPAESPGAMHLLARTIDRGTERRPAETIAEDLDSRGISLSISVNRHQVVATCMCLADDFDDVFELIGEIVMEPAFPESELATRRREVVTAIRQDQDNPAVTAAEGLMSALYGADHPYGRPQKGTIASVERLTRDRLNELHARCFAPDGLSAVVVGDVDAASVVDAAQRVFGRWTGSAPPGIAIAAPERPASRRRIVVPMMNKAQADIAYGFTSVGRSDRAYYAYWLMNNVLGQYALGGRLGDNIRERQGMAYYVSSILDANVIPGPLMIRAGVSPNNVDRAIAAIDHELALVRDQGITLKELEDSRQYLIGAMPRALETNAGIANFLQTAEFFDLGLDYDLQLPALLHAVTLDEANAAARRTLDPDRATIVVAGPYQP